MGIPGEGLERRRGSVGFGIAVGAAAVFVVTFIHILSEFDVACFHRARAEGDGVLIAF